MMEKLFIIGNGFDLAHGIPSKFDPDFVNAVKKYEYNNFWEIYQIREESIWSDFENLIACPNFNSLEEIFNGYEPDYLSDKESDRDNIITQVGLNGKLNEELYDFANNAEKYLKNVVKQKHIEKILDYSGYYISFNYTHTLESIYGISSHKILHIHGEVGKDNLMLGYPKGNFVPEKYSYDARAKGIGPYAKINIENYFKQIEDYYIQTAYEKLYNKCKSFNKEIRVDQLRDFLDNNKCCINEIIVLGHSCNIDFDYFNYLNNKYTDVNWTFYIYNEKQKESVENLIKKYQIFNYNIKKA